MFCFSSCVLFFLLVFLCFSFSSCVFVLCLSSCLFWLFSHLFCCCLNICLDSAEERHQDGLAFFFADVRWV